MRCIVGFSDSLLWEYNASKKAINTHIRHIVKEKEEKHPIKNPLETAISSRYQLGNRKRETAEDGPFSSSSGEEIGA